MFLVAPHLLFLLAVLGAGLASDAPRLTVLLCVAFGIGLYMAYRRGRPLPQRAETALAVLAIPVSVILSTMSGEHLLFCLRPWLTLMLVFRAWRRMTKRDYVFCFLITAVLFVYVGASYDELPFLLLILANLLIAPYALFGFLVRHGGFRKAAPVAQAVPVRFTAQRIRCMTGITLWLTATTVLLFLLLPRPLTGAAFGTALQGRTAVSGMSEDVPLGTFDEVVEHGDIVMTVETDKPKLWRSKVFDHYEGGVWRQTAATYWRKPNVPSPVAADAARTVRRFTIFNMSMTGMQLPCAGEIVAARETDRRWPIWINDFYATLLVRHQWARQLRGTYEVTSHDAEFLYPSTFNPRVPWRAPTGSGRIALDQLFVRLPSNLPDRVRAEALRITSGAASVADKARAVERYLKQNFTYSLADLESGELTPLEYFLFESKKGHCEYFATAMAILLRCAGVSTRVVQGFVPGTLVDDRYVVRLSDAHLWTEVLFPGKGWKAYDPTPGQAARDSTRRRLSRLETLRLKWQTYVLQYDGVVQAEFFSRVRAASARAFTTMLGRMPPARHWVWIVPGVLLAVLALRYVRRFRIRLPALSRRRRAGRPITTRARSCFGKYLKALARKGYKRAAGTTPNDLVAALQQDAVPVLEEARLLTQLFYRERFGGLQVGPDDEGRLKHALRRVRSWAG